MAERLKNRTVVIDRSNHEKIEFYKQAAKDYGKKIPEWAKHYLYTKPFYTIEKELNTTTIDYFHDLANIVKALNLPGKSKILDVACGPGWLSEYLYRFGYDVTGIDISSDLLQTATERISTLNFPPANWDKSHIRFVPLDLEVDYLNEQFDAIVFYDCLHHFIDENKVIENAVRMLAGGGKVLIKEGAMPPADSEAELRLLRETDEFNTLESPFDHDYLMNLLDKYGLRHVKEYVEINGFFEKTTDNYLKIQKTFRDPFQLNFLIGQRELLVPELPNILARWSANIGLLAMNQKVRSSSVELEFRLRLENTGEFGWTRDSTLSSGSIAVGFKLFNMNAELIEEHAGRTPIPHDVQSSESCDVSAYYLLPLSSGIDQYVIQIDLVLQGYFWFKDKGSTPLTFRALRENGSWNIQQSAAD